MGFKLSAFIGLAILATVNCVSVSFSGRNLPAMDIFYGAPDAYINIYYAPSSAQQYQLIGNTKDISDNNNPDWPELFEIPNNGGSTQLVKIDMYDADSPDSDDYMGYVELTLMEIINDRDGLLTLNLTGGNPGGGQLLIKRLSRTNINNLI